MNECRENESELNEKKRKKKISKRNVRNKKMKKMKFIILNRFILNLRVIYIQGKPVK